MGIPTVLEMRLEKGREKLSRLREKRTRSRCQRFEELRKLARERVPTDLLPYLVPLVEPAEDAEEAFAYLAIPECAPIAMRFCLLLGRWLQTTHELGLWLVCPAHGEKEPFADLDIAICRAYELGSRPAPMKHVPPPITRRQRIGRLLLGHAMRAAMRFRLCLAFRFLQIRAERMREE